MEWLYFSNNKWGTHCSNTVENYNFYRILSHLNIFKYNIFLKNIKVQIYDQKQDATTGITPRVPRGFKS